MGRNVHISTAVKHRAHGRPSVDSNSKRRETKMASSARACAADVGAKIQQLRARMAHANGRKSSNAVLIGIQLLMFLVILNYYIDVSEALPQWNTGDRESRRMFGGYRITPRFCTPTRTLENPKNRGPSICMFNHECAQRKGEVVGVCTDNFLFGACCRLSGTPGVMQDSVQTGVVMMLDPKRPENEDLDMKLPQLSNVIAENSNTYYVRSTEMPMMSREPEDVQISSHYVEHPSTLAVSISHVQSSTEKIDHDLTLAQIANTLLQAKPDTPAIIMNPNLDSSLFSYSTISHDEADTVLLNKNGTVAVDISRPSDFTAPEEAVQVSTMQTKPSQIYTKQPTTTVSPSVVTHKPVYQKPAFRPKPNKKPTTNQDKFVLIPTVTKKPTPIDNASPSGTNSEIASIESIMNMLNDSHPSTIANYEASKPMSVTPQNKLTTVETIQTTVSPQSYSSGHPLINDDNDQPVAGHYITTASYDQTTYKFPSTSYVYGPTVTRRPGYSGSTYPNKYGPSSVFHTRKPVKTTGQTNKPSTYNNEVSTSTLSYDEYWGSVHDKKTTKKPPSTSYIFSSTPTKRPISNIHNVQGPSYDVSGGYDTFSSVTPTVIVLSSLDSQYSDDNTFTTSPIRFPDKQGIEAAQEENQNNYVEVPLKPHKKPVHQVTINNIITSNNMIQLGMGKPSSETSSPSVYITPKPNTGTLSAVSSTYPQRPAVSIEYPDKIESSTAPSSFTTHKKPSGSKKPTRKPTTSSIVTGASVYDLTTIKNPYFTSADDYINFPPVRNPNLNATGSNPIFFNSSVSSAGVDDAVLQEVEFTTPTFLLEDDDMKKKIDLFVNKIVIGMQGTFQELHDIVILDKSPNTTILNNKVKPGAQDELKPTKKPSATTKRPNSGTTSKRPPTRATTIATRKPTTTKKPVRTATTKTTTVATTTPTTTKKPVRTTATTKKPKPTRQKTTIPPTTITTVVTDAQVLEEESYTTETPDGEHKFLCGVRPMVKSGRIVGGKGATFGEWPWQVLVRESTWLGLFTKNKCGGVLITNRFVTTAAHCQPGFLASLVAVFGKYDISAETEPKRAVTKNVRRVIVHRQYDAATFENDLALLELESPVHFDSHIVPICMPTDEADFTGRTATVTGWGRLKYGGGVPSVLQVVNVPIMENSMCQEMFHTAGHSKTILPSFLCAGYANGQKDSCEGDSGGPLVLQRSDGRWELAGTVSHGIKCAAPYLPGVYMRTTFYKPWLHSITGV